MSQLSGKEKGRVFWALGAILIVIAAIAGTCEKVDDRRAAMSTPPPVVAPIAPAPPRPVVKTVKSISTIADLQFTDGSRLRLKSPDPDLVENPCIQRRQIATARKLLVGQRVTITNNAQTYGPKVTLSGNRYYDIEFSKATFGDADRCGVSYPPSSSGGGYYSSDDDHHSRRYCRKHRYRC